MSFRLSDFIDDDVVLKEKIKPKKKTNSSSDDGFSKARLKTKNVRKTKTNKKTYEMDL